MENFPLLCLFLFLSFSLACTEEENVLTMNINVKTPVVNGLSAWTFYNTACPKLYSLIHQRIKLDLQEDVIQAAEMLCLHFHNCFVQGCDGFVPLGGPASEQDASLHLQQTFEIINDIIGLADSGYPVSKFPLPHGPHHITVAIAGHGQDWARHSTMQISCTVAGADINQYVLVNQSGHDASETVVHTPGGTFNLEKCEAVGDANHSIQVAVRKTKRVLMGRKLLEGGKSKPPKPSINKGPPGQHDDYKQNSPGV